MQQLSIIALFTLAGSLACGDTPASPDTTPLDTSAPTPDVAPDADTGDEIITTMRCPVSRFTIAEGDEVLPGTTLHLDASQSYGLQAPIVDYAWQATTPDGTSTAFAPSPDIVSPTFVVTTPGFYRFHLRVTDDRGFSCDPAEQRVFVTVDDALRIELTWTNPDDPDPSDDYGADLDLHFLHPLAVGGYNGDHDGLADGWYDLPFDCFWSNESPNWGHLAEAFDNPHLLDSTSNGPEVLTLGIPEDGSTYRVGVHYWSDHDLQTTYATVRIYYSGTLVFEASNVALEEYDLWSVTTLTWPPTATLPPLTTVCAGTTTPCTTNSDCATTCGPRIAPDYHHPDFLTGN